MRDAFQKRARMLEMASHALKEDRIWPHYQPKVCLKTGTLIGLEALLRWQHPCEGLQSPASIMAAFDTPDLAVKITDRILDCVLKDINRWRDQGLEFGRIAVNATAADFMRGDFAKRLLGRLEVAGVLPQHIELEVTENVLVGGDAEKVGAMLRDLSHSGMTIALDDFGTGYASLSHLNSFPVDVLKIDRSFVQPLSKNESARDDAIVRAIIGLARNMRILTVAEGVETASHAGRLQALRCDIAQGYLFSRPVSAAQVPSLLTQGCSIGLISCGSIAGRKGLARSARRPLEIRCRIAGEASAMGMRTSKTTAAVRCACALGYKRRALSCRVWPDLRPIGPCETA